MSYSTATIYVACCFCWSFLTDSSGLLATAFVVVHPSRVIAKEAVTVVGAGGKQQPRRNLKKRNRRKDRNRRGQVEDDFPWDTAEARPVVASEIVEKGEDYWIDEEELAKSLEREQAIKNRKAMEGEISQQKLREEVVAPYKQNWIGLLSVAVIVLATIITKFPELLQPPLIPIPDL